MHVTFATDSRLDPILNEDFIATTSNAVVLLDGVGVTGTESGCIHGTPWFVAQLGSTLAAAIATDYRIDLADALADAISTVKDRHRNTCDVEHPGTPSATALVIRERDDDLDYLVLADSVLLLDTTSGVEVVTDGREAPIADMLRGPVDATPNGTPEHQAAVDQFMANMAAYRNVPHGFFVASNNPDAVTEAITGSVNLADLHSVAVLTDGASRLADTYHLTDWEGLHAILAKAGPLELIRQVRDAERSDPHGERWKRGKANDDATAAYCTFTDV